MKFQSIADIYEVNERARTSLKDLASNISNEQADVLLDGEKWTIAQIVEHIAMVDEGTSKICAKLIRKAQEGGASAAEKLNVSDDFLIKSVEVRDLKIVAPERVQPTGSVSIGESLNRMDVNRQRWSELRSLFQEFDGDKAKFPHPFFGEISAVEWLIMAGGHEARHTEQIRKLLNKLS
jgi:hypothetical protein